jgi:hypothetical protein
MSETKKEKGGPKKEKASSVDTPVYQPSQENKRHDDMKHFVNKQKNARVRYQIGLLPPPWTPCDECG